MNHAASSQNFFLSWDEQKDLAENEADVTFSQSLSWSCRIFKREKGVKKNSRGNTKCLGMKALKVLKLTMVFTKLTLKAVWKLVSTFDIVFHFAKKKTFWSWAEVWSWCHFRTEISSFRLEKRFLHWSSEQTTSLPTTLPLLDLLGSRYFRLLPVHSWLKIYVLTSKHWMNNYLIKDMTLKRNYIDETFTKHD